MKDWRTDISEIDSLNDCDPYELMIYLRHMYLDAAKDLISCENEEDKLWGY